MEYETISRNPDAFQRPLSPDDLLAMCRRVFGSGARVVSAVELGGGYYNNVYRLDIGAERPVVLRVAPEPARQSRAEPELLRNEHAAVPYLAPIAPLLPRTLGVDFTHDVIGRDYLFQTFLDGVPAGDGLEAYPRGQWRPFFRQLGEIAGAIHRVRGRVFGRLAGPGHDTWSGALHACFEDIAVDTKDAGLDAGDIEQVMAMVDRHRAVLDAVDGPRLLHGDLWVGNVMIAPGAAEPAVAGLFDCDRAWWGDPAADWPVYLARKKPGTERDGFWEGYGEIGATEDARWRFLVYSARHAASLRLEYHRFGMAEDVTASSGEIAGLLTAMAKY